jgi:glucose/arabinose dehydrogenase
MTAGLFLSAPVSSVLAQTPSPCPANPSNVNTLPGYSITAVACGLNFPTAMTFGGDGTIWVTEEGTASSPPAVKRIDNMGIVTTKLAATDLAAGTIASPLTGIVFHRGWFWLIHRQTNSTNAPSVPVGAISRFQPNDPVGTFQTLIAGFPSFGDHPNSQIVFGDDGRAYINGAAPTNSSVPGPDDGWLTATPTPTAPDLSKLSDFAGVDVELSGIGYRTLFPFRLDMNGGTKAAQITYPFMPFGAALPPGNKVTAPTPQKPRQVVLTNGTTVNIIAGGGTVYSFDPNADPKFMASTMRLEGWGFRNPYGIGLDPFNPKLLFVSNNGADVRSVCVTGTPQSPLCATGQNLVIRGSRPIANDRDDMFVINIRGDQDQDSQGNQNQDSQGNQNQDSQGKKGVPFFGHPDYFHDFRIRGPQGYPPLPVTNPLFCPTGLTPPTPPVTVVEAGQCSQFAFSDQFRAKLTVEPAFAELEQDSSANMFDFSRTDAFGYKGDIFIAETGSFPPGTGATALTGYKVARIDRGTGLVTDFVTHPMNTQAVIFVANGFNKPIDVRFRGSEMFVVDFGDLLPGVFNVANSGKIWKVTHQ